MLYKLTNCAGNEGGFLTGVDNIGADFSWSRRHQIRNLCYYLTTYMTHFQYRFMSSPVKFSFNQSDITRSCLGHDKLTIHLFGGWHDQWMFQS